MHHCFDVDTGEFLGSCRDVADIRTLCELWAGLGRRADWIGW